MRDLALNELSIINGGYQATIKPSDWVASAAAGAAFGAACCVVTAFSANPVLWPVGIATGSSIAVGLHMAYDVLRVNDL